MTSNALSPYWMLGLRYRHPPSVKTLTTGSAGLIFFLGMGNLFAEDLSLVVKQQPATKNIQVVLKNKSAVAKKCYDSLSPKEDLPAFIWCQFANRDKHGAARHESKRISLLAKSSEVIEENPRLRSLNAGEKVSRIVQRDRIADVVEDIIVSDRNFRGFNAIRFIVSVSRNTTFSRWVSATSEYFDVVDYRVEHRPR